jgi:cullin-4
MLVKNFKLARKVDPKVFLDQTWSKIDAALDIVFTNGEINFSLEELYRGVENLCRQGLAKDVCERLVVKSKEHITSTLKAKVKDTVGRKDVDVLRATLQAWATWGAQMVCLSMYWYGFDGVLTKNRNMSIGSSATSTARTSSTDRSPSTTFLSTSFAPSSSNTRASILE